MNTFTYSYTGTLQAGRASLLFPNAFASKIPTDLDDIYLGTCRIVNARASCKIQTASAGPVVASFFDYLNNTTQLPILGGSTLPRLGQVNLGATPTALRSITHPVHGVVSSDLVLNDIVLASIPSDLAPSLNKGEHQINTVVSATVAESEIKHLGIKDAQFLSGLWIAIVNNSTASIVGSSSIPAFTISIDYEPYASGWERKRRQGLPTAAATAY